MKRVITICGSMRFYDQMLDMADRLTSEGYVVLFPFRHVDHNEELCEEIHNQRIDMSDEVFVVNPGGYIGNNTIYNVKYAASKDKPVSFMTGTLETKRLQQTLCKHFSKDLGFNKNPILDKLDDEIRGLK